mgnify:CR=1 FL=1
MLGDSKIFKEIPLIFISTNLFFTHVAVFGDSKKKNINSTRTLADLLRTNGSQVKSDTDKRVEWGDADRPTTSIFR